MWVPQTPIHKLKIAIHFIQALLTFVTACLTLAILTEQGSHDSRVKWCFALCFLTMPALLYQCIVPCWTRTWRLANPYIYIAIDSVFTVFWISAFAAITAWTEKGMKQGAIDKNLNASSGSCSTFAFGTVSKCNLAKATTGLGVVLCILFLAAACISGLDARRFWTSGATSKQPEIYGQTPSQTKDEWSSSTEDLDTYPTHGGMDWGEERQHSFALSTETKEGHHPGRQLSYASTKTIPYEQDFTPSALSPTSTEERSTRIFPPASYSFSNS